MSKRISATGLVLLALSLLLAIGTATFFGPCIHEDGAYGACHWAGQAELGIGIVLALQALLLTLVREKRGVLLAMLPTAVLGILVPGTLISLCQMSTMRCRSTMQPATIILSALILLIAAVRLLTLTLKTDRKATH